MARRGQTEEIHIHIRGHAPEIRPMLASEIEELVHRILGQGFDHARAVGNGPGQTQVRLALKLEPIEHVTDFSSHPMGDKLKEIVGAHTPGVSMGRLKKKHPGWILEYLASQISTDGVSLSDESLSRKLLTDRD